MDIDVVRETWQADWLPPGDVCASLAALCVVGCDGRVLYTNSAFRRTVDLAEGDMLADAFVEAEDFHRALGQTIREGRLCDRELALRSVVGVRWVVSAWRHRAGRNGSFIEVGFIDITERKRAEDDRDAARIENARLTAQLRDARDALLQTESLASLGSLVAGITHEVCTPLGIGVTAASHLFDQVEGLRDGFENGRLRRSDMAEFLATAVESTRLLVANLIRADELIQSFKRVAVDRTSGARRTFDLRAYLEEILFTLRPRLKRASVAVELACPGELAMDSYPGALSQVIGNLVINALVHAYGTATEPKSIHIQVVAKGNDRVAITVADQGVGIAPENLVHVFEPYFTTRRGEGGSGLGLHIVHNAVTRVLGGTVSVESLLGHGTRFIATLPREAPPPRHADRA